jgi:hypothetical protein
MGNSARRAAVTAQQTVWVVGDWQQAEFAEAMAWLTTAARCTWCDARGSEVFGRRKAVEDYVPPKTLDSCSAILLVQSRPGQISRGDVERMHVAAPLARLVALVGEWCDGELRSGRPWPGVVRVPVNSWRCRLEQELGLSGGAAGLQAPLPRTATPTERLESTLALLKPGSDRAITAAVFSGRRANYEAIADLLQQLAINSIWSNEATASVATADLLIFDGWEEVSISGRLPAALPRLLLLHFSRREDHERAAREGFTAVLAIPVLITDLAQALRKAILNAAGTLVCFGLVLRPLI